MEFFENIFLTHQKCLIKLVNDRDLYRLPDKNYAFPKINFQIFPIKS